MHCTRIFQIFNAARSCFAPEEEKQQILADLTRIYGSPADKTDLATFGNIFE